MVGVLRTLLTVLGYLAQIKTLLTELQMYILLVTLMLKAELVA